MNIYENRACIAVRWPDVVLITDCSDPASDGLRISTQNWAGYQNIVSKFSHALTTTTLEKQTTVLDYTDSV